MIYAILSSLAVVLSGIGLSFAPGGFPDRPVPDDPPQDGPLIGGLMVPEGVLMVFNTEEAYFTLLIQGEEVRNVDQGEEALVFMVDKSILQMNTTSADVFLDDDVDEMTDSVFAARHQQYEEEYLSGLLRENVSPDAELKVDAETYRTTRGITYRLWKMEVEGLPTQVLASVALPPAILVLSTAFNGEEAEEGSIELIRRTVESVDRRHKPIDFKQVQDSIQALYGER